MLWNLILEFYIQYIFGGYLDGEYYYGNIGSLFDSDGNIYSIDTADFGIVKLLGYNDNFGEITEGYLPLGNYFSFIATIITMILILVVCFTIIKKCFNIFNRVF